MNTPFTPPEIVPARRDWHASPWDRPVRESFLTVDDEGRTGLVPGDDLRRVLRKLQNGVLIAAASLLLWAGIIAGLRAGGVL